MNLLQPIEKFINFINCPWRWPVKSRTRYPKPVIVTRDHHTISRQAMSRNAIKVLYRLHNSGFQAYLVGGGVRDLLLGREPKDFDIATDARPEQVRKLFRNCRLIGRRFRLAHVFFGVEIIEVATFRSHTENLGRKHKRGGMILRDNIYGNIDEDAWRRDFTINALYYNIADFSLLDYTQGLQDINEGVIRLIGDPVTRYQEDPVRMLRAVRFAVKLGFNIHPDSETPIFKMAHLLGQIAPARLFEETIKLFLSGQGMATYSKLYHYHLFEYLFPATTTALEEASDDRVHDFLQIALQASDARIAEDKPVTLGFFFAVMLWHPVQHQTELLTQQGIHTEPAFDKACKQVLREQSQHTTLPRRITAMMHDIWFLQRRFELTRDKRALNLVNHPKFRAGYDFLMLRAKAGEPVKETFQWWTDFYEAPAEARIPMLYANGQPSSKKRTRRHRKS